MFAILSFFFLIIISNSKFFLPLVRDGFLLWYRQLLPTLFPAMIFTNLLTAYSPKCNSANRLSGVYQFRCHLFGVSKQGLFVIVLGFLGGFPICAFLVGRLVRDERISKEEGQHLLNFCNNIGPAYFVGVVFPALSGEFYAYKSILLLITILFYLIPLSDGIITARIHANTSISVPATIVKSEEISFFLRLDQAVWDSVQSIIRLAGYIVFFRLFLILPTILNLKGIMRLVSLCLVEITTGISAWQSFPITTGLLLIPFLSLGGLSCIAQTYCMIRGTKLSLYPYLFHKSIQSLLLVVIMLIVYYTNH